MTSLRRKGRRLAAIVAVGVAAVGLSACDSTDEPTDLDAGKTSFVNLCASCHTLEDAGTPPSAIGPNLDDSWRASRQAGFDDDQFQGLVQRWIKMAQPPMPRDLVTGEDAVNVAAYIASVAGRSPESDVYPAQTAPQVPVPSRQELKD